MDVAMNRESILFPTSHRALITAEIGGDLFPGIETDVRVSHRALGTIGRGVAIHGGLGKGESLYHPFAPLQPRFTKKAAGPTAAGFGRSLALIPVMPVARFPV